VPSRQSFKAEEQTTILVAAVRIGFTLRYDCKEAICGPARVKALSGQNNL
jgi:ferredoxin